MRITCWITKTTDTLRIFHTYCFATTTVVTRKRLNITLYVHCLSCYSFAKAPTAFAVVDCGCDTKSIHMPTLKLAWTGVWRRKKVRENYVSMVRIGRHFKSFQASAIHFSSRTNMKMKRQWPETVVWEERGSFELLVKIKVHNLKKKEVGRAVWKAGNNNLEHGGTFDIAFKTCEFWLETGCGDGHLMWRLRVSSKSLGRTETRYSFRGSVNGGLILIKLLLWTSVCNYRIVT
jgi:hypothetical protein